MSAIPVDKLRPRSSEPLPIGALLSTGAHILLVVALALGVSWRITQPDGGEAELWSAVPQAAPAPLPPAQAEPEQAQPKPEPKAEPKPEPEREAQIAEQPKPKPVKQEKPKPQPKPQEPPKKPAKATPTPQPAKAEPQEKALKSTRSQTLNRMFSELGSDGGEGTARSSKPAAGNSDAYIGRVRARVKSNIKYWDSVSTSREAVVRVRCDATGRIVSRQLITSSGLPRWDEALIKGIDATEVLPLNEHGKCPEMDISLSP